MRKIHDFRCTECEAVTEHFIYQDERVMSCTCGGEAKRLISAPKQSLNHMWLQRMESGDRWAKIRATEQAKQQRSMDEHGTHTSQSSSWDKRIPEGYVSTTPGSLGARSE